MTRRRALALMLLIAVVLALASCGAKSSSTSSSSARPALASVPQQANSLLATACPPDRAFMGCSQRALPTMQRVAPLTQTPPGGLEFPDVSAWQKAVSWPSIAAWQRAHGWHPFGIFKMGEGTAQDTYLHWNATQSKGVGAYSAGYWFVRPINCATEAQSMEAAADQYGLRLVVLDMEVPGLVGYVNCLSPVLEGHGHLVAVYTSPGSWAGGNGIGQRDVWIAAYGPSAPPCAPWTCNVAVPGKPSINAWQFTDGQWGPVVSIPGVGAIDVSVSYGIEKLAAPPGPKPPPPPPPVPPSTRAFNRGFDDSWAAHNRTKLTNRPSYMQGVNSGWKP